MTNFTIVDCGVGNLRSVQKVFEHLGATATITNNANDILSSDGIVLPGVGAFGDAMGKLESDGVANVIRHEAGERGKPLLGICLGMQLLGRSSAESPGTGGLGLVPADTVPLDVADKKDWIGRKLTLPHIGWSDVTPQNGSALFDALEPGTDVYFVHSDHLVLKDPTWLGATADYGQEFVCSIDKGVICATQFHPEKSQKQGQALISNFIARTKLAAAA